MLLRGKKALVLLLALTFALSCVGLAQAAEITLKLSHEAPTTDQRHTAAMTFARVVEEKTGGKVTVKVYPGGALGGPKQVADAAQKGNTDIVLRRLKRESEMTYRSMATVANRPVTFLAR